MTLTWFNFSDQIRTSIVSQSEIEQKYFTKPCKPDSSLMHQAYFIMLNLLSNADHKPQSLASIFEVQTWSYHNLIQKESRFKNAVVVTLNINMNTVESFICIMKIKQNY